MAQRRRWRRAGAAGIGPAHAALFAVGLAVGLAALFTVAPVAHGAQVDVAEELARLRDAHGFEVTGEDLIEDSSGRAEGEDLFRRLRLLLERFDHIIVQSPDGGVARVIILGRTNPAPRTVVSIEAPPPAETGGGRQIVLPTIRNGNQHAVRVSLEGAEGRRVEQMLLIDTGATSLVLPASLIVTLGIAPERLGEREVRTANGMAQARYGRLPAVHLDGERVDDVEVAFLEDAKLGPQGLLGMSVLGRFQLTIDDAHNQLTLTRR